MSVQTKTVININEKMKKYPYAPAVFLQIQIEKAVKLRLLYTSVVKKNIRDEMSLKQWSVKTNLHKPMQKF